VLIWLLMELDGGVLLARRKPDSRPLAGQWTLPGDIMRSDESSAETIWRVGREMLDIQVIHETFVDTLYIKDNGLDYAINVFSLAFEGQPRYRESGPFAEVRWCLPAELPKPLPEGLAVLLRQEGGRPPKEARTAHGDVSATGP
jgi:ADP-ribose pyrophosphatase YjhB (NUDIX family)